MTSSSEFDVCEIFEPIGIFRKSIEDGLNEIVIFCKKMG